MDTNITHHLGAGVTLAKLRLGFQQYPDIRRGTQLVKILNPGIFDPEFVFFAYDEENGNSNGLNLVYARKPSLYVTMGEKAFRPYYPNMSVKSV